MSEDLETGQAKERVLTEFRPVEPTPEQKAMEELDRRFAGQRIIIIVRGFLDYIIIPEEKVPRESVPFILSAAALEADETMKAAMRMQRK